jgi:hypothetical protein
MGNEEPKAGVIWNHKFTGIKILTKSAEKVGWLILGPDMMITQRGEVW